MSGPSRATLLPIGGRFFLLSILILFEYARVHAATAIAFNKSILPILSENCFECHGPDANQRQAGLRLDRRQNAVELRDGAAAIVPGDVDESEIVQRILSTDPDTIMPPPESKKELTKEETETLQQWIREGAVYQQHWAFEPIPQIPASLKDEQASRIVDHWVQSALEAVGLSLSETAPKTELIRRASFDLTGLPPHWEDVHSFVNDHSPQAFERVIDRLLASPEYGERWGRHWLDLARYADTHGASAIGFLRFPFSYTYRDYVVQAFNDDRPYNRFIEEQIAADQLNLKPNDPAYAGLGFLTVGRQFRNRHDLIDDQIDVITRGLLGLTVTCARCHDHKFDAIPTTDYYSLHATLANSESPDELPLVGSPPVPSNYLAELEQHKKRRDDLVFEQGTIMRSRLRMQVGLYLEELAKGTPEQDTSTTFLSYRTDELRPVVLENWRQYLNNFDVTDPVFGPWHQLLSIEREGFKKAALGLVESLESENGEPKEFKDQHRFPTPSPKWNPRVLEELKASEPESMIDVARAYGRVFESVHRRWLTELLNASEEATPDGQIIPDEDAKHQIINSDIERQLRRHLFASGTPTMLDFSRRKNLSMLNRGVTGHLGAAFSAIDGLNHKPHAPPRAMALQESLENLKPAFVFERGNPIQRGEPVWPRFLTALKNTTGQRNFPDGQRRLGLARAIVDPKNPLTRRVIANWVWLHHFGQGLVATPDDFGTRGRTPSHPELLDYLAEFLSQADWSLKRLHKLIMLSKSYQQSARENAKAREIDPENRFLWRMPTRRLEMEAMRDSMLAASGELEHKGGGKPFEEKDGQTVPRRSLYAFVNRDVISSLASTFDAANPSTCTLKRPETLVPQQTLFALNSDFVQQRAAKLIELPEFEATTRARSRIQFLYRRLFSRAPSPKEIETGITYLEKDDRRKRIWVQYAHALLASNEFHFVD